jgi:hypothetical protein
MSQHRASSVIWQMNDALPSGKSTKDDLWFQLAINRDVARAMNVWSSDYDPGAHQRRLCAALPGMPARQNPGFKDAISDLPACRLSRLDVGQMRNLTQITSLGELRHCPRLRRCRWLRPSRLLYGISCWRWTNAQTKRICGDGRCATDHVSLRCSSSRLLHRAPPLRWTNLSTRRRRDGGAGSAVSPRPSSPSHGCSCRRSRMCPPLHGWHELLQNSPRIRPCRGLHLPHLLRRQWLAWRPGLLRWSLLDRRQMHSSLRRLHCPLLCYSPWRFRRHQPPYR